MYHRCTALFGKERKIYFCVSGPLQGLDTINHNIMLSELEYYGIRGKALEWFKSYLASRRQYVDYRGTHSEIKQIEYGVPQGSVLGSLLFIIYSNDIPHAITYCKTILFADDTTVYLTHMCGENIPIY